MLTMRPRVHNRYEASFNNFDAYNGFKTVADYTTFANVTMRQRMTTYIAGGGNPPLIGEWSFIGA